MKDIYTTSTGLRLVKSFAQDESGRDHCPAEYEKNEHTAKRAARRLLSSGSLEIVNGSDLVGGLAYTSSGCFAGLWNCRFPVILSGGVSVKYIRLVCFAVRRILRYRSNLKIL